MPDISDVRICQDGAITWNVAANAAVQSSLYFRVKVIGKGQRASYSNYVNVSVNHYDLRVLNLSPGDYSIQVQASTCTHTQSRINVL